MQVDISTKIFIIYTAIVVVITNSIHSSIYGNGQLAILTLLKSLRVIYFYMDN